ncbi:XRE family transcriptional regulator [Antarctobacter heliothermus]|uniref:XRE family transcriptional regulator n=1 Tax=Antarctobacter heliothermus TaxID=74033 RepID=A0A222E561_9RHOB|nr:hypothetical protein [Antarctobacter heliothermus]ASP21091.1 XRE family transcriptional regulator [Antarctobacter heliothermus]
MISDSVVHKFFRSNRNRFEALQEVVEGFSVVETLDPDDIYSELELRLKHRRNLPVRIAPVADLAQSLPEYVEDRHVVQLSEALDQPNRVYQLVHVAGLQEH